VDAAARLDRAAAAEATHAVVVRGSSARFALAVGRLVGQRELVTRPLPPEVAEGGLSGAAVLSDGQIALIVDCDAITPTEEGRT
jgi:two-component system chemotaxis sensor kinase CheA